MRATLVIALALLLAGCASIETRRQDCRTDHPEWAASGACDKMARRLVWHGMTREQIRYAFGSPYRINRSSYQPGVSSEQWVYLDNPYIGKYVYLYLTNGKLTAWQM